MKQRENREAGFTLVELVIGLAVLAVVMVSFFALFMSLLSSATIAKQKAIATTIATNQMEYLKSLPFDSLAVAGGSIYATNYLPASTTQKLNGVTYTIKTDIDYVDDAYDGCASYPSQALKQLYCRNYPPPTGSPATDTNPQDYKAVSVSVYSRTNVRLATVNTQISARVAETASTTGALFVTVIDDNGNPVSDTTVSVANTTITPNVGLSDTTDVNGVAIFYGLPPDSGYDYTITATKTGYSSLTTIVPSGSLQPTYASQKIFTQLSSSVTMTIKPQGQNSLVLEAVTTAGTPLANAKIYIKGGYKKYTATTDTSYYFDTMSPSDTRPVTDASGYATLTNLVPGPYYACGDSGATSCSVGGTTYYLAAAVPYGGSKAFNPIVVPRYDIASPPTVTFPYNSVNYLQKVRLIFTTSSSFPRISTITPGDVSLSASLTSVAFQITGTNLPCNSNPASCNTTVRILQGANTYTASCTGSSAGTNLACTVNLSSGLVQGNTAMTITVSGNTLTIPGDPLIGGPVVIP